LKVARLLSYIFVLISPLLTNVPARSEGFPINISLREYKQIDPLAIFLMRYRMDKPSVYIPVQLRDFALGRYNVEIGVVLRGRAKNVHVSPEDKDINFDIDNITCEITPLWLRWHPDTAIPQEGDLVEVRGWSYYDFIHDDKEDEKWRATFWEIHPVHQVIVLERAGRQ